MTELNMEERIAIRDSARSLKKYGSTSSNASTRQEHFIKHQISSTDTLQGLALKYSVTTEQIRRANKLWANDSIFLRSSLLIPVPTDSVTSPSEVVLVENEVDQASSSAGSKDENDQSYNDFLVKIDCSIASTKSQVMLSQDNSQFVESEDCMFSRKKAATSRLKQRRRSEEPGLPNGGTELPTVVTCLNGRKVRSSIHRLEQTHDSIFEL